MIVLAVFSLVLCSRQKSSAMSNLRVYTNALSRLPISHLRMLSTRYCLKSLFTFPTSTAFNHIKGVASAFVHSGTRSHALHIFIFLSVCCLRDLLRGSESVSSVHLTSTKCEFLYRK